MSEPNPYVDQHSAFDDDHKMNWMVVTCAGREKPYAFLNLKARVTDQGVLLAQARNPESPGQYYRMFAPGYWLEVRPVLASVATVEAFADVVIIG